MSGQLQMTSAFRISRNIIFGVLCFSASAVLARAPTPPQNPTPALPAQPPAARVPANQAPESSEPQTLHLLVGRSLVITSPVRIKRIPLADPEIAEAIDRKSVV